MGGWIKMDKHLPDKPEVAMLAAELGVTRFEVVGYMHAIWSYADTHGHEDGSDLRMAKMSPSLMDEILRFPPGTCDAIARTAGWLVMDGFCARLPMWVLKNGSADAKRAGDAKRKRESRARKKVASVTRDTETCHTHVTCDTPDGHNGVTPLDQTRPDQTRPDQSVHIAQDRTSVAAGAATDMPGSEIVYVGDHGIPSVVREDLFGAFWSVYPRCVKPHKARATHCRVMGRVADEYGITPEEAGKLIAVAAARYADALQGADLRMCPNPDKWLEDGEYASDPDMWNLVGREGPRDRSANTDAALDEFARRFAQ